MGFGAGSGLTDSVFWARRAVSSASFSMAARIFAKSSLWTRRLTKRDGRLLEAELCFSR